MAEKNTKKENKDLKKILIVIGVVVLAAVFLLILSVNKTHDNGGSNSGAVVSEIPQDDEEILKSRTWVWINTQMNDDSETAPTTPGAFTATFAEEGVLSAETDCNNGTGSYELGERNSLIIGPIASTRKACINDTNEFAYFEQLSEVGSYMIDEDERLILMLQYDSGSMIFE